MEESVAYDPLTISYPLKHDVMKNLSCNSQKILHVKTVTGAFHKCAVESIQLLSYHAISPLFMDQVGENWEKSEKAGLRFWRTNGSGSDGGGGKDR